MRVPLIALVPAIALLAACGNDTPAGSEPETTSKAATIIAAAAEQASQPSGEPGSRPLKEPLPGGVMPDFAYNATVDMSTQAGMTMRQIHLDIPELSAQQSMDRLVAQFEAAGLDAGEQGEDDGTLVRSVWTPVEGGAKGLAVIDAGGTSVALIGTDYEDDHSRRDDGYVAALRLQINSR